MFSGHQDGASHLLWIKQTDKSGTELNLVDKEAK